MSYTLALSIAVALFIAAGAAYDVFASPYARRAYELAFRARRFAVWFPLGLTYAGFYCARYAILVANVHAVRLATGFGPSAFSAILAAGFWTYAVSAPFMGWASDRLGGRRAVLVSTAGCAATNLLMGVAATPTTSAPTPSLGVILGLYALSMAFQGLGTSSIIKVNTAWYSAEEIGAFSGIFNVMVNSGYFLALSVSPLFVETYGFASVFYLPAGLLCAMCALLWFSLESDPDTAAAAAHCRACRLLRVSPSAAGSAVSPQQVDLELAAMTMAATVTATKVEGEDDELIGQVRHQEEKNAGAQKGHEMNAPRATASLPVDRRALRSPTFLAYLGCVMALCWVKDGLLSWAYEFLATSRQSDLSHDTTSLLGFAVTLGGFGGGILVNFVSERMCGGARALSLLLFSLLQGVSLVIFWFVSVGGYSDPVVATFFFLTATFLLGNYSALNFLVPAALPPSVVATASGLFTFTGYIGSGCAGIYYMSLNSDPVENGSADRFFAYWFASLCVATAATALFAEFARRRSRFKKRRRSVTGVMNNMAVDLESLFSQRPPPRRIASHKKAITAVRSAGIADEFLRGRMVRALGDVDTTTQFFQWPERKTLPCERLEWRADPCEMY